VSLHITDARMASSVTGHIASRESVLFPAGRPAADRSTSRDITSVRLMAVRDGAGRERNLGVGITGHGRIPLTASGRLVGLLTPDDAAELIGLLREAINDAALTYLSPTAYLVKEKP